MRPGDPGTDRSLSAFLGTKLRLDCLLTLGFTNLNRKRANFGVCGHIQLGTFVFMCDLLDKLEEVR